MPTDIFCLQHWISGRTVDDFGNGYWDWDLSCLFTTLHEAETERAEFHDEEMTQIVRMTLVEGDVVTP